MKFQKDLSLMALSAIKTILKTYELEFNEEKFKKVMEKTKC